MTQNEALKILVDTAVLAQKTGALTLDEAVVVRDAILVFKAPAQVAQNTSEELEKVVE